MVTKKQNRPILFVGFAISSIILLLFSFSIFPSAKASSPEEVYRILDAQGNLIAVFDNYADVVDYFDYSDETISPYWFDCDGKGNRHGSRTYTEVVRGDRYMEWKGNIYRVDYLVTYCYYCNGEISRESIMPDIPGFPPD